MILSRMFIRFILYSFFGWVWETIYCTIKEKHFQSRGFLFGPICPIYGVSAIIVQILFSVSENGPAPAIPLWALLLICTVGSAIIEYGTSWYLEKRFHARWWDYSGAPLNINGRICLPTTICFGISGVLLSRYIIPTMLSVEARMSPIVIEALALVLMGLFSADFALTEASLNALLQRIESADQVFSEKAEAAYQKVAGTPGQIEAIAKSAQKELSVRVQKMAASLTTREKNIILKIKRFSPVRGVKYPATVGEALKKAIKAVGDIKQGKNSPLYSSESDRK